MRKTKLVTILGLSLLLLRTAWSQPTDDVQTVTGFRVPTYDDQGNMTSQMFGDYARILPDDQVEITELKMEFYSRGTTNQTTDMVVTSPKCQFDRGKGVAVSDSPVRIARDNMVVTGIGFRWDNKEDFLNIRSQARVVLKNVRRHMDEGASP